jgi:hypothetical protein
VIGGAPYQHLAIRIPHHVRDRENEKKENPAATFSKPLDVVKDGDLSCQQKTKALDTWEQDARQLLTASSEGMPAPEEGHSPKDPNKLRQVVNAKGRLCKNTKSKPSH